MHEHLETRHRQIAEKWAEQLINELRVLSDLFDCKDAGRYIQSAINEATKAQQEQNDRYVEIAELRITELEKAIRVQDGVIHDIEARQKASGEREHEHQQRIGELEKTNKSIAEKIDQLSPYDKFMSHGEHQSIAGEYDDLMSEIRDLVESRPDLADKGVKNEPI